MTVTQHLAESLSQDLSFIYIISTPSSGDIVMVSLQTKKEYFKLTSSID